MEIDAAEAERRAAMQRTQAALGRARATIDEWNDMSELAKQRHDDAFLCSEIRAIAERHRSCFAFVSDP